LKRHNRQKSYDANTVALAQKYVGIMGIYTAERLRQKRNHALSSQPSLGREGKGDVWRGSRYSLHPFRWWGPCTPTVSGQESPPSCTKHCQLEI